MSHVPLRFPHLRSQSPDIQLHFSSPVPSTHKLGSIPLFDSQSLPSNLGGIAYVGGPISTLAYHPSSPHLIALSAHPRQHPSHPASSLLTGLNHIQLWYLHPSRTQCVALLKHQAHCAWHLKWRPNKPRLCDADSAQWNGVLAGAMADGSAHIWYVDQLPSTQLLARGIEALEKQVFVKRLTRKQSSAIRVVEWSPDGALLFAGCCDGTIVGYNACNRHAIWQKWIIPGHNSVIAQLTFVWHHYLCSVDREAQLQLRDIRDPLTVIQENTEGFQGCTTLLAIEDDLVGVATGTGELRLLRLCGTDGCIVRDPSKRIKLQRAPLRAMRALSVAGGHATLMFAAGSEGFLQELKFRRPLWSTPQTCHVKATMLEERLRWTAIKRGGGANGDERVTLLLKLGAHMGTSGTNKLLGTDADEWLVPEGGPEGSLERKKRLAKEYQEKCRAQKHLHEQQMKDISDSESPQGKKENDGHFVLDGSSQSDANSSEEPDLATNGNRKQSSKKNGVSIDLDESDVEADDGNKSKPQEEEVDDWDFSLFGDNYNQHVVISAISASECSDMLAVGTYGGVLTWLKLNLEAHNTLPIPECEEQAIEDVEKLDEIEASVPKPQKETKKVIKPPRKRGRPRKYPLADAAQVGHKGRDKGSLPITKENASGNTGAEKEKNAKGKDVKGQGAPKATAVVLRPRRKRGRPRKMSANSGTVSPGAPEPKRAKMEHVLNVTEDINTSLQSTTQQDQAYVRSQAFTTSETQSPPFSPAEPEREDAPASNRKKSEGAESRKAGVKKEKQAAKRMGKEPTEQPKQGRRSSGRKTSSGIEGKKADAENGGGPANRSSKETGAKLGNGVSREEKLGSKGPMSGAAKEIVTSEYKVNLRVKLPVGRVSLRNGLKLATLQEDEVRGSMTATTSSPKKSRGQKAKQGELTEALRDSNHGTNGRSDLPPQAELEPAQDTQERKGRIEKEKMSPSGLNKGNGGGRNVVDKRGKRVSRSKSAEKRSGSEKRTVMTLRSRNSPKAKGNQSLNMEGGEQMHKAQSNALKHFGENGAQSETKPRIGQGSEAKNAKTNEDLGARTTMEGAVEPVLCRLRIRKAKVTRNARHGVEVGQKRGRDEEKDKNLGVEGLGAKMEGDKKRQRIVESEVKRVKVRLRIREARSDKKTGKGRENASNVEGNGKKDCIASNKREEVTRSVEGGKNKDGMALTSKSEVDGNVKSDETKSIGKKSTTSLRKNGSGSMSPRRRGSGTLSPKRRGSEALSPSRIGVGRLSPQRMDSGDLGIKKRMSGSLSPRKASSRVVSPNKMSKKRQTRKASARKVDEGNKNNSKVEKSSLRLNDGGCEVVKRRGDKIEKKSGFSCPLRIRIRGAYTKDSKGEEDWHDNLEMRSKRVRRPSWKVKEV